MQPIKQKLAVVLLGLSAMLPLPSVQAAKVDFAQLMATQTPALNRQGIQVWTYREANNPAFSYVASTVVDAPVASVVATLGDSGYLSKWVPQVDRVEVIHPSQDGVGTIRMVINFPFPAQDRDIIVKSIRYQQADGSVVIKSASDNSSGPPPELGIVRVTAYEGDWVLKPVDGGRRTQVVTSGFADPGGMIPIGVVNLFVEQQPYLMLRKMKQVVRSARYARAVLDLPRR